MSKLRTVAFLTGLVVVAAGLLPARAAVPAGYRVVTQKQLGNGVDYLNMKLSSPAEDVHVAHVAPGAPVALRGVNSHDLIPHGVQRRPRTAQFHVPAGAVHRGGQR